MRGVFDLREADQMATELLELVKSRYTQSHQRLLKLVDVMTDEQLAWQPTPTAHSVAFQVWHAARIEDYFQFRIAETVPDVQKKLGPARQIWTAENLATRWDLDPKMLGIGELGEGMDDRAAAGLRLPRKDVLLDYTRKAFAGAERAVDALTDEQMTTMMKDWAGDQPIAGYVVEYLAHTEWDIGQIACLRRAQDLTRVIA